MGWLSHFETCLLGLGLTLVMLVNIVLTKGCFLMASWCVQDLEISGANSRGDSPEDMEPQNSPAKHLIVHIAVAGISPGPEGFTTGNTIIPIWNPYLHIPKFNPPVSEHPETVGFHSHDSAGEISDWRVSNPFRHRAGRAPATLGEVFLLFFGVELEVRNGSYLGCNFSRKTEDFFNT